MNHTHAFRIIFCLAGMAAGMLVLPSCSTQKPETARAFKVTHMDAHEAGQWVAAGKVVVLDLRTPAEYAAGHIHGATNLDFNGPNFARQLDRLDRNTTYLLHCNSGRRSTRALPEFSALGFKHVLHLDGGIQAWRAAGNPVQQP